MATSSIILSPKTAEAIEDIFNKAPQAILISGPKGVGKATIARHLVSRWLDYDFDKISNSQNYKSISSADGIEAVRGLRAFSSLKVAGHKRLVNRVAFIDDAEGMNTESQNAILKLLEEPPEGMVVIMSAESTISLLPTIISRVSSLRVVEPEAGLVKQYFIENGSPTELVDTIIKVVGPLPGLVSRLLADGNGDGISTAVGFAKQILGQTLFERLVQVDSLSKNKDTAEASIDMLILMSSAAMRQIAASNLPGSSAKLNQWQKILEQASLAKNRLASSGQAKIVLTDLMLNI